MIAPLLHAAATALAEYRAARNCVMEERDRELRRQAMQELIAEEDALVNALDDVALALDEVARVSDVDRRALLRRLVRVLNTDDMLHLADLLREVASRKDAPAPEAAR